jgi:hypothetical protein
MKSASEGKWIHSSKEAARYVESHRIPTHSRAIDGRGDVCHVHNNCLDAVTAAFDPRSQGRHFVAVSRIRVHGGAGDIDHARHFCGFRIATLK